MHKPIACVSPKACQDDISRTVIAVVGIPLSEFRIANDCVWEIVPALPNPRGLEMAGVSDLYLIPLWELAWNLHCTLAFQLCILYSHK